MSWGKVEAGKTLCPPPLQHESKTKGGEPLFFVLLSPKTKTISLHILNKGFTTEPHPSPETRLLPHPFVPKETASQSLPGHFFHQLSSLSITHLGPSPT